MLSFENLENSFDCKILYLLNFGSKNLSAGFIFVDLKEKFLDLMHKMIIT